MKKFDRFILKSFIGPFIAILCVAVFVLVMQFIWVYVDELVGKGLGFGVILEFMMWGGCTILYLAIPLATLLSSMMVVGQMAENKELMAIKASGVSFGRVMLPLVGAALVISILAFFSGNNLAPKAFNEIMTLRQDIKSTKSEIKIPLGVFYDGIEGYVLRINEKKDNGTMTGVMVYDHTGNAGNTTLSIADSATIKMSSDKSYLIFSLFNGSNYQETNKIQYRDTNLRLERINFRKQELVIKLNNYSFEKSDSVRYGEDSRSMGINQLKQESDTLLRRIELAHPDAFKALSSDKLLRKANQLDTAMRSKSANWFHEDEFLHWRSSNDAKEAYSAAVRAANLYCTEITINCGRIDQSNFFLRLMKIGLFKKFAQALACLILFFIGAPLGALIKKGGLGVSAIVSVLFFMLYWVVDISGTKLANNGTITPALGIFISALVLGPIGWFLTKKAIEDSDIFSNMDSFKIMVRKLWSKIFRFFKPMRIVYMGTPEFAVAPLVRLIAHGYKIVGVVTVADKPSGRGLKMNESPVKQYAVAHGIPVLQPVKLKDPDFLKQLSAWKADLFVVVAFRMLPEEVWKMPHLGTFNLHAALLPQYRGAAPINWAVINGEKITGVTTFMIDHNIDTGGIIFRQECRIDPEDNAGDIHDKLMTAGSALVVQTVQSILEGTVELRTQRSFIQGSEVLKSAPKLTRETCRINWNSNTVTVHNLIRGLSPYPAAFTEIISGEEGASPIQMKIFRTEIGEPCDGCTPGTILSDGKTGIKIVTANGSLSVLELQLQGKKRMGVEEFLRGFRGIERYKCI